MNVMIRESDTLTDRESQQLFAWGEDIFETAHLGLTWRPKDLHFFLYVDNHLASHAALLKHVITVDGQPATVAGLGGVVTLPWAQRQGLARALVTHAMRVTRDWNVDGGLLFCISKRVPYYAGMGWDLVNAPVLVEQPAGTILAPVHAMVMPYTDRLRSISRIDLNSPPW